MRHHPLPLVVEWIPAHVCENIPAHLLDPCALQAAGTTVRHVLRNRDADLAAKKIAKSICPIYPKVLPAMTAAAGLHQEWLVKLHCHLSDQQVDGNPCDDVRPVVKDTISLEQAKLLYPQWPWQACRSHYTWKPKIPFRGSPPKLWKYGTEDWHTTCDFLRQLRWCNSPGSAIAFCELAVAFHSCGFRFQHEDICMTIHEVVCRIRLGIQYLLKDSAAQPCLGTFSATYVKSCGRVLPQSAIMDAMPFLEDRDLACTLSSGPGRTIESWRVPFLT